MSVADESGNVETGIGANTSTDVADAIKKAVKGNSSIEADGANENDLTLAPCRDKAEKTVSEKGHGRVGEKKQ